MENTRRRYSLEKRTIKEKSEDINNTDASSNKENVILNISYLFFNKFFVLLI